MSGCDWQMWTLVSFQAHVSLSRGEYLNESHKCESLRFNHREKHISLLLWKMQLVSLEWDHLLCWSGPPQLTHLSIGIVGRLAVMCVRTVQERTQDRQNPSIQSSAVDPDLTRLFFNADFCLRSWDEYERRRWVRPDRHCTPLHPVPDKVHK